MQQTASPDVDRILDILFSQIRHILRDRLVGLYLYGSLTTGDFDLGTSDIDLLAATASDLNGAEFEELHEMHRALARDNKAWDERIEVAYLSVSALRTFRVRSSNMAVISPGESFHVKEAGKDWLMNWYMVRERGVALFGPPPKAIIGRITPEEFVQAVREHAAAWGGGIQLGARRKAQAYAILTMCRALYTHKNSEQASKRQAALWAQEELPQWSKLIHNALEWREARLEEKVDHTATYPETVRFVKFMQAQILARVHMICTDLLSFTDNTADRKRPLSLRECEPRARQALLQGS